MGRRSACPPAWARPWGGGRAGGFLELPRTTRHVACWWCNNTDRAEVSRCHEHSAEHSSPRLARCTARIQWPLVTLPLKAWRRQKGTSRRSCGQSWPTCNGVDDAQPAYCEGNNAAADALPTCVAVGSIPCSEGTAGYFFWGCTRDMRKQCWALIQACAPRSTHVAAYLRQ